MTPKNKVLPNEKGSYIDNDVERETKNVMMGQEPTTEYGRDLKKELDSLPDDAVVEIPSDI